MHSFQLVSHVNEQGILQIQLPFDLANQEVEVILAIQPKIFAFQNKERPIGLSKNIFEIPQSFFEPLPETIIEAFESKIM
jgi:hypothetical protein